MLHSGSVAHTIVPSVTSSSSVWSPVMFGHDKLFLLSNAFHCANGLVSSASTAPRHRTSREASVSLGWLPVRVRDAYMASNWPLRIAVASPAADFVAVAGRRGLCVYNVRLGRWRLFGDVQQEEALRVHALGWLGNEHVLVVHAATSERDPGVAAENLVTVGGVAEGDTTGTGTLLGGGGVPASAGADGVPQLPHPLSSRFELFIYRRKHLDERSQVLRPAPPQVPRGLLPVSMEVVQPCDSSGTYTVLMLCHRLLSSAGAGSRRGRRGRGRHSHGHRVASASSGGSDSSSSMDDDDDSTSSDDGDAAFHDNVDDLASRGTLLLVWHMGPTATDSGDAPWTAKIVCSLALPLTNGLVNRVAPLQLARPLARG